MLYGFMGKILRVDLTAGQTSIQTFSEAVLRKYIGGSGLGAKILYDETSEKTDPLGPENVLIFMTGPVTGTLAPNFGRHEVVAKSPLTGRYGEANSGGSWGVFLKRAGYDGVVFTGKAAHPVYLWISDGEAQIRPAAHLWGKDTFETDEIIKTETHPKAVISCIGQAGERLVRIAGILNDGADARAAARCGLGAVMGSKNLKAVAVYGTAKPQVHSPDALKASVKEWAPVIRKNTNFHNEYGTAGFMTISEQIGDLPVKNWKEGSFEAGAEKLSGKTMCDTILRSRYHCHGCVIGCGRTIQVGQGKYEGVESAGPEYETLGMLGSNCLVDNLDAVAKANELCNRFGLDTISTGGTISFAMELYEKEIISQKETGGIALEWGNADAMLEMIRKIAYREDIGWLLGEGSKRAAEAIGGRAAEYCVHVKGMEFPAHDPRAKFSNAVAYATSERGACHLSAYSYGYEMGASIPELGYNETLDRFASKGKGIFVAKMQNFMAAVESLIACRFIVWGLQDKSITTMVEWLNWITGWDFTTEEFLQAGERSVNLKRLYNCKCGASRKDDALPPRVMSHARPDGGAAGKLPDIDEMLDEYYQYRGWSDQGIPKEKTITRLAL